MADIFTKEKRSSIMSKIRSSGSTIEETMANRLKNYHIKFEKHPKGVFGKPDFVIRNRKIAIFCDSEFWHGRNWKVKQKEFKSRKRFWISKIEGNIKRDKKVNKQLKKNGWIVLRFWDTKIEKNSDECVKEILETMVKK